MQCKLTHLGLERFSEKEVKEEGEERQVTEERDMMYFK